MCIDQSIQTAKIAAKNGRLSEHNTTVIRSEVMLASHLGDEFNLASRKPMGDGNECNKKQSAFSGTKQKRIPDAKEKKIQAPVKLRVLSLNCHVYPVHDHT